MFAKASEINKLMNGKIRIELDTFSNSVGSDAQKLKGAGLIEIFK